MKRTIYDCLHCRHNNSDNHYGIDYCEVHDTRCSFAYDDCDHFEPNSNTGGNDRHPKPPRRMSVIGWYLLGIALVVLIGWLLMVVCQWNRKQKVETVIEHDTIWKDTTIYEPVATESVQTGRTVLVPYILTERDTLRERDTLMVPVEIEQKRYDDSLYTAWVSGYEPALDSICLHQREVVTTITKTITKPAPRISVGIQAGAGYGIFNRKADVYVGVGVQWRIFKK